MTIVDKCPCEYFYEQRVCCGPMPHFDLSYYWACEKLAHPIQGKIMIQFRPVACGSRTPVDARLGAAARMETRAVGSEDGVLSRADRSGQRVARVGGGDESGKDERRRPVVVFENGPALRLASQRVRRPVLNRVRARARGRRRRRDVRHGSTGRKTAGAL